MPFSSDPIWGNKSIIKDTIRRDHSHDKHQLTEAEVDHAADVANKLADGHRNFTWGELADAGVAAVLTDRERK